MLCDRGGGDAWVAAPMGRNNCLFMLMIILTYNILYHVRCSESIVQGMTQIPALAFSDKKGSLPPGASLYQSSH